MNKDLETVKWPSGWDPMEDQDEADALLNQLHIELGPAHPLYGRSCRAIARADYNDDVMYQILDAEKGGDHIAVVHLTWSAGQVGEGWPSTEYFEKLEDWLP